jgi:ABC-type xylose transport system permease subunit
MFTKADIEKYFIAEKSESLLFMIIGAAAIVLAILFFFLLKTNWYKGAAVPLIVVGVMHLVIGYTVYNRSDADRQRNVYAYDMNPSTLKTAELPRMEKVNRNFVVIRYVEIFLLLSGLVIFFYLKNDVTKSFWVGLGLALALEAALSLGADYFAESRAKVYTKGLKEFTQKF